jgi:transcriptional regulator with XRE-family HTH domain
MSAYEPEDTSLLLQVLRAVRGWDQAQFAAAVGVSQGTISRYESGERLRPPLLVKIADAAGLGLPWVERYLLPVLRAARTRTATAEAQAAAGGRRPDLLPADQRDLTDAIGGVVDAFFAKLEADLQAAEIAALGPPPPPAAGDREEAARAWERLAPCTAAERRLLVEECAEYHGWALAERLCHESAQVAATEPAAALDLAHLAVAVAQLTKGGELWGKRLLGYARAHLAHALQLTGDLAAFRTERARAWDLWRKGAEGDAAGLLEEGRLLVPAGEKAD